MFGVQPISKPIFISPTESKHSSYSMTEPTKLKSEQTHTDGDAIKNSINNVKTNSTKPNM